MMARKDINYATPDATPVKKAPKRPGWYFDSPLKRVTKDLFGAQRSKLNNAKSSLFFVRILNAKDYKLTGTKKRLKSSDVVVCNTDRLYTKRKQEKELKKHTGYRGLSASQKMRWKNVANHHYRNDAANAKATYRTQKQ